MYASVGGELLHYGVKGMKWGVRKEYKSKGRDGGFGKNSEKVKTFKKRGEGISAEEFAEGAGIDLSTFGLVSDWDQTVSAYGVAKNAWLSDRAFNQWLERSGNKKEFEDCIKEWDSMEYSDENDKKRMEIAKNMLSIYDEYRADPSEQSEEEEKEYHKIFAEMVDKMPKPLPKGVRLTVKGMYIPGGLTVGPFWIMTNAAGEQTRYNSDQLDALKRDIEEESKKTYGFNETAVGKRVREKNVTSSKPVKVQKGKSIKISDKERSKKVASSKKSKEKAAQFVNGTLKMLSITKSYRDKFKVDTDPINRLPSLASKRKTSEPKVSEKKEEVKKLEKDGRNWLEKLLNIHEKSK